MKFLNRLNSNKEDTSNKAADKALERFQENIQKDIIKSNMKRNLIKLEDVSDKRLIDFYEDSKKYDYEDLEDIKKEIVRRALKSDGFIIHSGFGEVLREILEVDYILND